MKKRVKISGRHERFRHPARRHRLLLLLLGGGVVTTATTTTWAMAATRRDRLLLLLLGVTVFVTTATTTTTWAPSFVCEVGSTTVPCNATSTTSQSHEHTTTVVVEPQVLAFIHVPKTAGSTFWSAMHRALGSAPATRRVHLYPPSRANSYNSPGCARPKYGGTHCGLSQIDDCLAKGLARGVPEYFTLPGATRRYVTIVREPVARMVSEYYWWRGPKALSHWTAPLVEATLAAATRDEGLERWAQCDANNAANRLAMALTRLEADPVQPLRTQCTAYDPRAQQRWWGRFYNCSSSEDSHHNATTTATAGGGGLVESSADSFFGVGDPPPPHCWVRKLNADDAILEHALSNLRTHFAFVGLTEDLARSVALCCALFGLPDAVVAAALSPRSSSVTTSGAARLKSAPISRKIHSSGRHAAPSPELRRILEERSRLDVAIYAFAKERFEATWQALGARVPDLIGGTASTRRASKSASKAALSSSPRGRPRLREGSEQRRRPGLPSSSSSGASDEPPQRRRPPPPAGSYQRSPARRGSL
mmetsp:Transcript_1619/g.6230  ORF Transcript_1619/g.6230 Transcript_1619/m.6230 type:complete len:536 (-) Transcript_1619:28-1635(-)